MTQKETQSIVAWPALLARLETQTLLTLALCEDIGQGDVTTRAVFAQAQPVRARVLAKTPTVVCGVPLLAEVCRRVDASLCVQSLAAEGAFVAAGTAVAEVTGDVRGLLTAERTALNFMQRLCGIATAARAATLAVPADCRAKIYDTRKTAPGFRGLDKAAVRTGGACNHRVGLFDAVLIKDNHVAAAGGVAAAIRRARAHSAARGLVIEVEVDTLDQLDQALLERPDLVLLDNMSDDEMREAVRRVAQSGQAIELEASGGITAERIAQVARTGVHRISLGALTHTVRPADLSLDII